MKTWDVKHAGNNHTQVFHNKYVRSNRRPSAISNLVIFMVRLNTRQKKYLRLPYAVSPFSLNSIALRSHFDPCLALETRDPVAQTLFHRWLRICIGRQISLLSKDALFPRYRSTYCFEWCCRINAEHCFSSFIHRQRLMLVSSPSLILSFFLMDT